VEVVEEHPRAGIADDVIAAADSSERVCVGLAAKASTLMPARLLLAIVLLAKVKFCRPPS